MNTMHQNVNFQLGLLYFVHLLDRADGFIDEKEKKAVDAIKKEEKIPDPVIRNFEKVIARKSEEEIYQQGLSMLDLCDDEEKLCVFVHLYRLSEAEDKIHVKRIRLLLYSIKATNIAFEDVELGARMAKVRSGMIYPRLGPRIAYSQGSW